MEQNLLLGHNNNFLLFLCSKCNFTAPKLQRKHDQDYDREQNFLSDSSGILALVVTPECVDHTESNVRLSDCRSDCISERKNLKDCIKGNQSLQALPNVNNRDRFGEDSTEKIGAAEVDQKKVVIAFKKLFPKD